MSNGSAANRSAARHERIAFWAFVFAIAAQVVAVGASIWWESGR